MAPEVTEIRQKRLDLALIRAHHSWEDSIGDSIQRFAQRVVQQAQFLSRHMERDIASIIHLPLHPKSLSLLAP